MTMGKGPFLLKRVLEIEKDILQTKAFKPANEVSIKDLEPVGLPCCLLIGSHRFENVQFYANRQDSASSVANMARRSSLSLLHMYINGGVYSSNENSQKNENDIATSSSGAASITASAAAASKSIKDLLAKSPNLVSLLNNTVNHAKKPTLPYTNKSKNLYFAWDSTSLERFTFYHFPSNAIVEQLSLTEYFVQFETIKSKLNMVIRTHGDSLLKELQMCTHDQVTSFIDFLPSIIKFPNISYIELCLKCLPPPDLTNENLYLPTRSFLARPTKRQKTKTKTLNIKQGKSLSSSSSSFSSSASSSASSSSSSASSFSSSASSSSSSSFASSSSASSSVSSSKKKESSSMPKMITKTEQNKKIDTKEASITIQKTNEASVTMQKTIVMAPIKKRKFSFQLQKAGNETM